MHPLLKLSNKDLPLVLDALCGLGARSSRPHPTLRKSRPRHRRRPQAEATAATGAGRFRQGFGRHARRPSRASAARRRLRTPGGSPQPCLPTADAPAKCGRTGAASTRQAANPLTAIWHHVERSPAQLLGCDRNLWPPTRTGGSVPVSRPRRCVRSEGPPGFGLCERRMR